MFLRGANVGGHKKFQPSSLAKELAGLAVVNVGAAGTFVVRGKIGQASVRVEILRRLPFKTELMICPAREIIDLARGGAFAHDPTEKGVRRFVGSWRKHLGSSPAFPSTGPRTASGRSR